MLDLNRVSAGIAHCCCPHGFMPLVFQKFRSHVLESDNSMNLVVDLLCYGLEIKDKPRKLVFSNYYGYFDMRRATWAL
jgi:hypothetical protein